MLQWFAQNIGSIIIIAVLTVVVAMITYYLLKNKKAGRSSCSGNCTCCCGCKYENNTSQDINIKKQNVDISEKNNL